MGGSEGQRKKWPHIWLAMNPVFSQTKGLRDTFNPFKGWTQQPVLSVTEPKS